MSKKNDSHRKVWFELNILGTQWQVLLVEPTVFKEFMANREGVCISNLSVIMIDRTLSNARKPDVFFHELMHAINGAISLEASVKMTSGTDDAEETLVSLQAPVLFDALTRSGMLKIPKIPAGW